MSWNYREQYQKINQLNLEYIKKRWEKLDLKLFKTRDKSKYMVVDFEKRKRNTIYGVVIYKRRIYKYYNTESNQLVYVCLVDEKLELPKYKRIGEDIEQNVIAYFADGKRYKDIRHTMLQANVNRMTICRIFKKYVIVIQNISKIKLEPNQPIYISIDDGHRKFWEYKRKINKYSMRLVVFYTDNINHTLVNKRASVIIRPNKTVLGAEKTADFILEQGKQFFENFDQAQVIICGDSAGWIKKTAEYLNAKFILDKFHLIKVLYLGIIAGNKGKYYQEYNTCRNFIENGEYDKLLDYLKTLKHKKLKKKYFLNNKQGITNQSCKENIGCFAEINVWHILKSMLGNRTYNIETYKQIIIFKCQEINLKP
ncbi:Mbov_0401 family ICE element transposase-like protein [Spiroplasma endosymbiont of Nebria brevicollis]|uniref:Mbov_0401 family ICE element transposase-like protein n=1 Tax=Spiroplasma endosymbiont of Nebria brevicollis TaxID=3066284 RepID=UPI00313B0688